MKKLTLFIILTVVLSACNFSKGVKKDLSSGLYYSYNGFKLNEVIATNGYNERLTDNKLPENSILVLYFNNVEGYKAKDGYVNLGCELTVTDNNGNIMLKLDDLYKGQKITVEDAKYPHVRITLAKPIVAGNTYMAQARLFDKNNPKNTIDVEMSVEVTPNEVDIKHSQKVFTFKKTRFGLQQGELPQNKVRINNKAAIVIHGIEGFTIVDGKAYPGCSVKVTDSNNNAVLQSSDIFSENSEGCTAKQAEDISIEITYANLIKAGNTYHVYARVFDKKNAEAEIIVDMDVEVVE